MLPILTTRWISGQQLKCDQDFVISLTYWKQIKLLKRQISFSKNIQQPGDRSPKIPRISPSKCETIPLPGLAPSQAPACKTTPQKPFAAKSLDELRISKGEVLSLTFVLLSLCHTWSAFSFHGWIGVSRCVILGIQNETRTAEKSLHPAKNPTSAGFYHCRGGHATKCTGFGPVTSNMSSFQLTGQSRPSAPLVASLATCIFLRS